MEAIITDSGAKASITAEELTLLNRTLNTMVNGKLESIMEQALSSGLMAHLIKENGRDAERQVEVSLQA